MSEFKFGDKVYTITNSVWGKKPMKVIAVLGSTIRCEHPFYGTGSFSDRDLVKASSKLPRIVELKTLNALEKRVEKLYKKLFENK